MQPQNLGLRTDAIFIELGEMALNKKKAHKRVLKKASGLTTVLTERAITFGTEITHLRQDGLDAY